ncbi:30S ribosomal protein S6 [Alienimonas californiensis]|uniref:Small ribosomal subunit protein bS6 n=1 Tax=Alienimonas californiensis TaxID=2527989 RepID=A0A517PF82_9PLAN|nr:30S ribosomal protein S6 [Alienimonas californiensis]QDT18014.1 30S ribosomal protein S6 [Alienimonas californiensis]
MPATAEAPAPGTSEEAHDPAVEGLYEGMFVFDSADYATDGEEYVARVLELIGKAGGSVDADRMWVDGRLAYPIRNKRKGVHHIVLFRMPPKNIKDLDRACRLEDRILRHMVIRPPEEIYHATVDVVNPSDEGDDDVEVPE